MSVMTPSTMPYSIQDSTSTTSCKVFQDLGEPWTAKTNTHNSNLTSSSNSYSSSSISSCF